jgi:hypothetical protein
MQNDTQIPEIFRLIVREAQRERSPKENEAAKRYLYGRATLAEYLAARRPDAAR